MLLKLSQIWPVGTLQGSSHVLWLDLWPRLCSLAQQNVPVSSEAPSPLFNLAFAAFNNLKGHVSKSVQGLVQNPRPLPCGEMLLYRSLRVLGGSLHTCVRRRKPDITRSCRVTIREGTWSCFLFSCWSKIFHKKHSNISLEKFIVG